jgi:hypothetical protein
VTITKPTLHFLTSANISSACPASVKKFWNSSR